MAEPLVATIEDQGRKIAVRQGAWSAVMQIEGALGYLRFLGEQAKKYERRSPKVSAAYGDQAKALMQALQEAEKIREALGS